MADETRRRPHPPPEDPDDLADLRRLGIKIFLALSVLTTLPAVVGPYLHDATVRVDLGVLGLVYGITLTLLGIELGSRWLQR
jgi:hypothetical protein